MNDVGEMFFQMSGKIQAPPSAVIRFPSPSYMASVAMAGMEPITKETTKQILTKKHCNFLYL